jgi:hypothetical protein
MSFLERAYCSGAGLVQNALEKEISCFKVYNTRNIRIINSSVVGVF